MSVRLQDNDFGEGYYLQHSFPLAPTAAKTGKKFIDEDVNDYTINAQHAFCTSIADEEMTSFLETLAVSGQNLYFATLDLNIVEKRVGEINVEFIRNEMYPPFSKVCMQDWQFILSQL